MFVDLCAVAKEMARLSNLIWMVVLMFVDLCAMAKEMAKHCPSIFVLFDMNVIFMSVDLCAILNSVWQRNINILLKDDLSTHNIIR